jgi:hypothetical protein
MDGSMVFFFDVSTLKNTNPEGPEGPVMLQSGSIAIGWVECGRRSLEGHLKSCGFKMLIKLTIYIYYDCICADNVFLFIAIKISWQIYNIIYLSISTLWLFNIAMV